MSAIRADERLRSAALRAVSGEAAAELRGLQLLTGDRPSPVNSPYLTLAEDDDRATSRGLADALAMVVCHNDPVLHRRLRPDEPIERVVYDTLEQLRCQSLAPDLPGVRANLAEAVDRWCRGARAAGVAESGIGLLIYTTTHMARARLGLGLTDEEVDTIIEGPRARLGRLLGHALKQLGPTASDQAAFAEPACEIARLVAEMAADTAGAGVDGAEQAVRYRMIVPAGWLDDDQQAEEGVVTASAASDDDAAPLGGLGGYHAFTTEYDVTTSGSELYPSDILRRARSDLDERVRAQAISAQRLALRLRRILGTAQPVEIRHGMPEGRIDARRLAQLVTTVDPQTLFLQSRDVLVPTTAVTLLLDNSGSMKAHRFETMAVLADVLSRALDLAGVTNEVLGHSTNAWTGGRALEDWKRAGRPDEPGRVAELLHLVYKDADTPWRRARRSLAAMQVPRHFRESVDGEAIVWAHQRLLRRPEPRKILVVVSDGAPAESGTSLANGTPHLLGEHLTRVVSRIESRSPVEIAAFSIGGDVGSVFAESVAVDLDATLTLREFHALESLFV